MREEAGGREHRSAWGLCPEGCGYKVELRASLVAQLVKNLPAMWETLGSIPGSGRSPGEGKGYPLQYSGLENSMDCIVHEVAKSRTRLSNFHFTSLHFNSQDGQNSRKEPCWWPVVEQRLDVPGLLSRCPWRFFFQVTSPVSSPIQAEPQGSP